MLKLFHNKKDKIDPSELPISKMKFNVIKKERPSFDLSGIFKKIKKKNNKNELNDEVIKAMSGKVEEKKDWIENLWSALALPARSIEVEMWVEKNKGKALLMRGKRGENMLHWGVLSNLALVMALIDANLDINHKDNDGKTPFDWLMERYNVACVTQDYNINEEGKLKIKAETQKSAIFLWNLGGRPSKTIDQIKKGEDPIFLANIANGELWLIKLLYSTYGKKGLIHYLKDKRSMMHIWSLTPNDINKKKGYEAMRSDILLTEKITKEKPENDVLLIDEVDLNGRTSLWYLIDGFYSSDQKTFMMESIKTILELGADVNKKDVFSISPLDLHNSYKINNNGDSLIIEHLDVILNS